MACPQWTPAGDSHCGRLGSRCLPAVGSGCVPCVSGPCLIPAYLTLQLLHLWSVAAPSALQASPPGGWKGPKPICGTQVRLQGAKGDQARKGLMRPESACHSSCCPLYVWQTGGSHLGELLLAWRIPTQTPCVANTFSPSQ